MRLHMIVGPTASGKTAASILLAHKTDAPVVVLDRFQCFLELQTVSCRPAIDELESTKRFYLDQRKISQGQFTTEDAYKALLNIVEDLSHHHSFLILEGGSVSLFQMIICRSELLRNTSLEILVSDPNDVSAGEKMMERATKMLTPQVGRPSMVQELQYAWKYSPQRSFIESICGFDSVLSWCRKKKRSIEALDLNYLTSMELHEMAIQIVDSHKKYADYQTAIFEIIRPSLGACFFPASGLSRPHALKLIPNMLKPILNTD